MDEFTEFQVKYAQVAGVLHALKTLGQKNDSLMRISQQLYQKLKARNLPEAHKECIEYLDNVMDEITKTLYEVNASPEKFTRDEPTLEGEVISSEIVAARNESGRRIDKEFLTNLSIDLNTAEDVNDFLEGL